MSNLVGNKDKDDVEPFKSAVPWCAAPVLSCYPTVNYPNKNLRVKILFFVGPEYYHDISPWLSGVFVLEQYAPRVDAKHPKIEVNSVIEICGTN